ncbi:hypothetical protein, partial [Pseudomonas viridiflava]|uniref:hypothetical protein n=1 Tax=Pseudomonas viridiflava TaxID=33069 RepID=UPI0019D1C323
MQSLSPGLIPAAAGLVIALVVVWLGVSNSPQEQDRLTQAWGNSQAQAVNLALRQISADTQAVASAPQLVQA